jgi:hypothetical protein
MWDTIFGIMMIDEMDLGIPYFQTNPKKLRKNRSTAEELVPGYF